MSNSKIIAYCHIKNKTVFVNGKVMFEFSDSEDLTNFLGDCYKSLPLAYPKFFKMDPQCKLGILATECLIRNIPEFELFDKKEMALIFSNSASSIESDRKHIKTISDKQNYFPSPSVFVYTLANIVTGEIAIKHQISGENAFFISEKFDAELMCSYSDILMKKELASTLLAGWINVDGKSAEAFVYCLKSFNFKDIKGSLELNHTSTNLQQLYAQ